MLKVIVLWSAWAQIELCHLGFNQDSKLIIVMYDDDDDDDDGDYDDDDDDDDSDKYDTLGQI